MSEVRQKLTAILETLEKKGEPYIITRRSCPKAVLVRYEDYHALVGRTGEGRADIVCRPTVSGGEPYIRGTRISVRHIIERSRAGQSVEDIVAALPHLNVAQIYAALSYYYDHQSEIDRLIEDNKPERVIAAQGLKVKKVANGVAVVHDHAGRW